MKAQDSTKIAATPVRLARRYSSGIVTSTLARAVSLEGDVLRVLSSEEFEPGIPLTASAPFLPAGQPCHVANTQRSHQPGYFLLELKLPAPPAPPVPVSPEPSGEKPPLRLQVAAGELAARLEAAGRIPFFRAAFERATGRERRDFAESVAAAVFSLLAQKGHVEAAATLEKLRKS